MIQIRKNYLLACLNGKDPSEPIFLHAPNRDIVFSKVQFARNNRLIVLTKKTVIDWSDHCVLILRRMDTPPCFFAAIFFGYKTVFSSKTIPKI